MRVGRVVDEMMSAYSAQFGRAREVLRLAGCASHRFAELVQRDPNAVVACPAAGGFDQLVVTLGEQTAGFNQVAAAGRRATKLSALLPVAEHAAAIETACDALCDATRSLQRQMDAFETGANDPDAPATTARIPSPRARSRSRGARVAFLH